MSGQSPPKEPSQSPILRDQKVLNMNPAWLRVSRELRGMSRAQLAKLAGMPRFRYTQIEVGAIKPLHDELQALARATGYPVPHFLRPEMPTGMEGCSLKWHSRMVICDVCERDHGIDDERAEMKCARCGLDLCRMHVRGYEVEVALPHGGTTRVRACWYCDACYDQLVSRPKAVATRRANRARRAQDTLESTRFAPTMEGGTR